jgi:ABC-2 type transport system ATP-binding protein
MPHPTIATVENVSKRFVLHHDKTVKERLVNFSAARRNREDFWALRDVDLHFELGSTVGLVGHNGSGKSTLLKVIGGIISPTTGTVSRRGRMAALLELGAGFHQDLTGRENVYLNAALLGLTRKETERYFDAIVDFSGIEEFIDTQVKFYSSGMYVRLAFAVAVHVDPDLLLVDEVLAVGDEPFQRKCMEKIAEFQAEGRAIIVVSHSLSQVGSLCDRVVVLDHGIVRHNGDTSEGLRILRAGFEETRVRELKAHDDKDDQDGTREPVKILEVTSSATANSEDKDQDDLEIMSTVRVNTAVPEWGIGFKIETSLGMVVYEFNSFANRVELPRAPGTYDIVSRISGLNLGEGQYSIDVGVGLPDGRTLDRKVRATSFALGRDNHGGGLVRYRPSFDISEAS